MRIGRLLETTKKYQSTQYLKWFYSNLSRQEWHVKDKSHQHVHGNISEELEGGVAWKSKIKTIKIQNKEKAWRDKRKKKNKRL